MRDIIAPTHVELGKARSDFFVVDADNGPETVSYTKLTLQTNPRG